MFLGPPGTGKTHLAIGLAIRACQAGHRVQFATASEWVARLADAHSRGHLQTELVRLGRYPLLIIDEVGYIPFEAEAANLFFQLVSLSLRTRVADRHLDKPSQSASHAGRPGGSSHAVTQGVPGYIRVSQCARVNVPSPVRRSLWPARPSVQRHSRGIAQSSPREGSLAAEPRGHGLVWVLRVGAGISGDSRYGGRLGKGWDKNGKHAWERGRPSTGRTARWVVLVSGGVALLTAWVFRSAGRLSAGRHRSTSQPRLWRRDWQKLCRDANSSKSGTFPLSRSRLLPTQTFAFQPH